MKIKSILPALFLFVLLTACSTDGKKSPGLLPTASGGPGEMIVVMDSSQWKSVLGREIRETFQAEVQGLPREERMFKINQVNPANLTDLLKQVRNLVFVVSLDDRSSGSRRIQNYFTKESLDKIRSDDELFVYTADNEFAKDQQVMYLFGNSESQLINHIRENRAALQNYFNNAEYDRLEKKVFKGTNTKGLTEILQSEHNCTMKLPYGYELVVNEKSGSSGFIWFRQMNSDNDKNIFITYRPYSSESMFSQDRMISLRDSVAKEQLFGDPDNPSTYVLTETTVPYIPVKTQHETFNGMYAMEMRGLWRTNNKSMGGPFLAYGMVDEALNRFYYIEGFVYSPGVNQREFIREMDVVLHSFKTLSQGGNSVETQPESE